MNYLELTRASIEHFSLAHTQYSSPPIGNNFTLKGSQQGNAVLVKKSESAAMFSINFNNATGCKVYIGRSVRGEISINFHGDNSLVYIGDNCDLKQLQIRSRQRDDFIAIGEEVSVSGSNIWVSGYGSGSSRPAIIVGDDCMFSFDVVLRNSDGHPVFNLHSDQQINEPCGVVHIEPHVWVGERSSILKDTHVGACSIIAMGSIVTRDTPRFSIVKGVPATSTQDKDCYWARDYSEFAISQAKYYMAKYGAK